MTRAGRMQVLLTLEAATDTQSGSGAIGRTWAPVSSVYADVLEQDVQNGGLQAAQAGQITTGTFVLLKIRWRPDLSAQLHRFTRASLWSDPPVSQVLDIVNIADIDGRRRDLAVRCKVRDAEGLRGESA